jgi:hypothetical protein
VAVQAVQLAADQRQQQQQQKQNGAISSSKHGGKASEQQQQQQQVQFSELISPATDPLIQQCLQALQLDGSSDGSSGSSGSSGSNGSSSGGLADWLQSVLGLEDQQSSQVNNVWLPTRCLQLLETIHTAVPHHTLIAADFNCLPEVRVAGRNAPLVSGRRPADKARTRSVVEDYSTVLVPWGKADIFFPTDFDGLGRLYQAAAEAAAAAAPPAVAPAAPQADASAALTAPPAAALAGPQQDAPSIQPAAAEAEQQQQQEEPLQQQQQQQRQVSSNHTSTGDFMAAFAEAKRTCTLLGYNPLVQDWVNTRIFVGKSG